MIVALLFIFILLQIADCLTTVHILKNGEELNPFLNWAFKKIGIGATLAIIKTLASLLVVWAWNEWLTFGLDVFYAGVVGWNSYQIVKSPKG